MEQVATQYESPTLKRCSRCHESKSVDLFYHNKGSRDGFSQMCMACHKAYMSERRRLKALESAPTDDRLTEFSAIISEARTAKGLTQSALGQLVGVTDSQIRLWESAKALPSKNHRIKLVDVLGIDVLRQIDERKHTGIPYGVQQCAVCGKPFPVYKMRVTTCSRECGYRERSKHWSGENSPSWRGGRFSAGSGYVMLRVPDQDSPGGTKCVLEHRHVMAQKLGRPLVPTERVHHKNGVRSDNRPDNLELWTVDHKDPAGIRNVDHLIKQVEQLEEEELAVFLEHFRSYFKL